MSPTTLQLPPLKPSPFRRWERDELVARIVALEVANFLAERRALLLAEEVRAARARERHLLHRLRRK